MEKENPGSAPVSSRASVSSQLRRMSRAELRERIHDLQTATAHDTEMKAVFHDLEVHQIELEMQNRELRESQQALEESLDRYVNLYDFAPTGYISLDDQGRISDINLTLAGMLGVERRWVIGRSLSAWISSTHLRGFRSYMKRCRTEEGTITTELQLIRKDKTIFPVELLTTRFVDANSHANLFRTAVTDITSRKKAEENLDRFFELSNDLLSLMSSDGYLKRFSSGWEKALGYNRADLLAHPFIEFVHPHDREPTLAQFKKMEQTKSTYEVQTRFVKKDRGIVWLTWTSVLSDGVYYSVARDSTQQVSDKTDSDNEQKWLLQLIKTIPALMILVEAKTGNVISLSSGISELIKDLPKKEGQQLLAEKFSIGRAAGGEELKGEQMIWQTPIGDRHLVISSRNIPAQYEQKATALILIQDVSDLKHSEQSLLDAVAKLEQERELRERFVSTLTHDLRTPLTAVKMSSQLILKRPENLDIHPLADRILNNVDRMDHMIHDLLDANRINAGEKLELKREICELHSLAKKTLSVLSGIHGDRFQLRGLASCPAFVEPMALRRVIENLCGNAVKYGAPQRPITVTIEKNDDKILLSVHNEGAVIPVDDQAILFTPFQRTSSAQASGKKGWGIGLGLVRGIAESHGGQVSVVSVENQGTTFSVTLPDVPNANT